MKTSVRFLSMLLAVLMIASAALTASAANAETTANSEALQLLVDLGIFGGYDDGSLKPDQKVERDEMAKIIFVLYTTFTDAGAGVISFKDVAADNWAAGYISWCASKGIVGGYGDGNFGPDDHVTYDQALKMVCGALGYNEWDSRLWPTDVRTMALKNLNLGENITDVKGSDEITRAQVAQIVYNALFADMNETKQAPVTIGNIQLTVPVPKTLAVDVWNFAEVFTYVDAAGKIGFTEIEDEDVDVILSDVGEFSLEDLGLEEYADNVEELFNANVRIIYDASKNDINAESIIATSVTFTGDDAVEITYNDKNGKIYLNGEAIDEDSDIVKFVTDNGIVVDQVPLTVDTIPAKDSIYSSIAYDYDDDGEYDAVVWEYLAAAKVGTVTDKKVSVALYGTDDYSTFDVEDIVSEKALEEDDVIIVSSLYDQFVVIEKVEPVVANATKYSGTKLTLTEVGEVEINKPVFAPNGVCTIDENVMVLNDEGKTEASTYYIYDGKVFGAEIVKAAKAGDLQFAIINYINEPSEPVLNETTMEFDVSYTAVISVDGKQQVVVLNPNDTIDGLKIANEDDQAKILANYGKAYVDAEGNIGATGKYLYNRYVLASYTVDENGYYTFATAAEHEDYVTYPAGSYIKYNEATGLYSIYAADDSLITYRVKIADAALIYYTYQKDATGVYTYLGSYTKSTLPEGVDKIVANSTIYATYNEDNKFSTVKLLVTDEDAIEYVKEEAKADFRTDARQLFYCYQTSNQMMADDHKNLNYTHFMRSVYHGTNLAETPNKERTAAEGAAATTQGFLYAWDEETKDYIKVTNANLEALGITSLGAYTLDEIINGYIVTNEAKFANGIKIDDTPSMWALGGTAASIAVLDMAGVQKSIDINKEYNEYHGTNEPQRIIIGTHINEDGEEVASVIIFQQFVYDAAGNPARNTTSLIYTNFGY